jgi:hypothetical protein
VLGLDPTANAEEIRAAYRRLAAAHHPDTVDGDASRMASINAAYDAIRKPAPAVIDASTRPAAPATAPMTASAPQSLGCIFTAIAIAFVLIVTLAVTLVFTRRDDEPIGTGPTAPVTTSAGSDDGGEPAPWTGAPVSAKAVPIATALWQRSPARDSCPLLVPAAAATQGMTARVIDVPGGWGVAWGRFGEPDVFGISAEPQRRVADEPIATLRWSDRSAGELRPVGDHLVATVRIAGIDCTYEVFSTEGFEALAAVLGALRFVSQR